VPIGDADKSKIYSAQEMQTLLANLGFVQEIGEYILDVGIKTKMAKVKKWLKKGINKVNQLSAEHMDEDKLIDDLVNDNINVDEIH
jgi:hypothetical protein